MFNPNHLEEPQTPLEKASGGPSLELSEQEKKEKFEALRDRYEKPHRDFLAKYFRKEKQLLREERDRSLARMLVAQLEDKNTENRQIKYTEDKFDSSLAYTEEKKEKPESALAHVTEEIKNRSLIKKIWYRFAKDAQQETGEALRQEVNALQKEALVKQQEKEKAIMEIKNSTQNFAMRYNNWQNNTKEKLENATANLRSHLQRANTSSKEAVRNTLEALEQGELDVSKLAKESNAIVVHTIPLEGWRVANTSMNNKEMDTEVMNSHQKIATIQEKQPDLSASILSLDKNTEEQTTMYPFGLIIDGKVMAVYDQDAGTETKNDARIRHPEYLQNGTLQNNTISEFGRVAGEKGINLGHNETIVHKPKVKAIFIDETRLQKNVVIDESGFSHDDRGDTVKEYFSPQEEEYVRKKYGESIVSYGKGTPTKGPHAGKEIFSITRKRSGLEKALEYAEEHYKELPVYLRRADGLYDKSGNKVDASKIYTA